METYNSSMFTSTIHNEVLIVKFTSNQTIYMYHDLGDEILDGFRNADSHGKFFIKNIQKTATFDKTEFQSLTQAIESID